VSLILDAGALIALDRNDRAMWRRLKSAYATREVPRTHGGVVGQVWRGGGARQARLATVLRGVEIRALDDRLGRVAGALLARTRTHDVIDAALVILAESGDVLVTSDPDDLQPLSRALDRDVDIILA
jgi:hypothetical protein